MTYFATIEVTDHVKERCSRREVFFDSANSHEEALMAARAYIRGAETYCENEPCPRFTMALVSINRGSA